LTLYRLQKTTLEEACVQLRHLNSSPRITVIKPGSVETNPNRLVPNRPEPSANVDEWTEAVINCINVPSNLRVSELSLGVNYSN